MYRRHVRDSRGVHTLRPGTTARDFHVKTTIDHPPESAHVLRFGAPSMSLVLALLFLRGAPHLKFIRTDWHLLALAHILRLPVIHALRLPSHLQSFETDRRLDVLTHLQPRYRHHSNQFPTANARLRLPVGANHRLFVRGMISAMDLLQTLGQTRRWLDLKGRLFKMEIHAVLRMALAALPIMDPMLGSRLQAHRQPRSRCPLTIDPPRLLFSPPLPAHVPVHLSAERAVEMVRTAHLNPAAVIPPNHHTTDLHASKTTILVPAMALHVTKVTILVPAKALLQVPVVRIHTIPTTVRLNMSLDRRFGPTTAPPPPIHVPSASTGTFRAFLQSSPGED